MGFLSAYTLVHKETEKGVLVRLLPFKSLQAGGTVDWIHLIPLPQLRGMRSLHTSATSCSRERETSLQTYVNVTSTFITVRLFICSLRVEKAMRT
jgi:hypothetical protein